MHKIHQIKCKTDNCYIVESNGSAILVDTGSGEAYPAVAEECRKYDLRLIVLTHVHFDHAENAAKLSKEFNVPVAFHKADEELFDNYSAQPLKSYGIVGRVVLGLSLKVLRDTKVKKPEKTVYIKEGDDLSSYGIDAKIIGLPGHTKGSVGVDVEGKSLLVGDALDNWIHPATGHLYSDIGELKGSAEKIRSLGEREIYYGHGKPTANHFKLLKTKEYDKGIRTKYEKWYSTEDYYWGLEPGKFLDELIKLCPPEDGKKVLDIGCGEGKDAVYMAQMGYEVSAFDLTKNGIRKTKKLARSRGVSINAYVDDINTFDTKEQFDIIYSTGTLQYLFEQNKKDFFDKINRITKTNGVVYFNVFVKKAFLKLPPDWDLEEKMWKTAELFTFLPDWQIERIDEEFFEDFSGGVPHTHCMDTMICRKIAGDD